MYGTSWRTVQRVRRHQGPGPESALAVRSAKSAEPPPVPTRNVAIAAPNASGPFNRPCRMVSVVDETGPSDHADRLRHGHRCGRAPGGVDVGHRLTRCEEGEAVQAGEDALHQRVTGIDGGRVGAERPARLTQDGPDDRDVLPGDVLLCREEKAALRARIGTRLDADDAVLPEVEVGIEDDVGHRHARLAE